MMIDSQRTPVFRGLEEEENQVTNTEKEQRVQLKKKHKKPRSMFRPGTKVKKVDQ